MTFQLFSFDELKDLKHPMLQVVRHEIDELISQHLPGSDVTGQVCSATPWSGNWGGGDWGGNWSGGDWGGNWSGGDWSGDSW